MLLTANEVAKMIDLSCVRTTSSQMDIEEMVETARKYQFGQVSVNQCFIPYTKQLLKDDFPHPCNRECELPFWFGFDLHQSPTGKGNDRGRLR